MYLNNGAYRKETTHIHAYLGLSQFCKMTLKLPEINCNTAFCVSVQDVDPRSEGRVLVRQPSHRPTYPISPHREGRPQLQPVPQRAGAGTPRHGPDIVWHETNKQKKTNKL